MPMARRFDFTNPIEKWSEWFSKSIRRSLLDVRSHILFKSVSVREIRGQPFLPVRIFAPLLLCVKKPLGSISKFVQVA
jgi:hypothetical protein